jgi:hypothetical protein
MAGAMTEIRDEICSITVFFRGSSWSAYVLLLCVCVIFFIVVFVFDLFFFMCSLRTFGILWWS